jgi:hypothetical protein
VNASLVAGSLASAIELGRIEALPARERAEYWCTYLEKQIAEVESIPWFQPVRKAVEFAGLKEAQRRLAAALAVIK